MNWKDKKVLVCGGAGMIGSHLARELAERGSKVTIVDNLSSGSLKNIEDTRADLMFWERDLRDKTACDRIVKGQDVVFQLAANMGGIGYITSVHADVMCDNTLINMNMLQASKKAEVPLYFYSSSACIYPNYLQTQTEVKGLKESDAYPADCNEAYGWEKLYSEVLCEMFQRDYHMNIRIARFHNIYGTAYTAFDRLKGKAPCHLIIKAIRYPEAEFKIWGDGEATRSFLYIDDCVEAVLRLMESDYSKPINIGSDKAISINELAQLIIDISGKSIIPKHDLTKPEGVRSRNSDNTLVKQVLGWEPRVEYKEGLGIVYHWAKEHFKELEGI